MLLENVLIKQEYTVKNTVLLSPYFLVWKFCEKTRQTLGNRQKLYGNCAFPQKLHTRTLG